jgi:hypothetical protein
MIPTVYEEIRALQYKLNALYAMGETGTKDYRDTAAKVERLRRQLDAIVNPQNYARKRNWNLEQQVNILRNFWWGA